MNASACGLNSNYFLFQSQLSDISKNLRYKHFTAKFTQNNLRFNNETIGSTVLLKCSNYLCIEIESE